MGKDLHNDNFEDFFRKHLESFDDEPSDAMWERIEPVIPPKPGIIWSTYALPSALILSVALLIFVGVKMFQYKQTSETLTEQLERSNKEIQSLTEQTIVPNDNSIEESIKEVNENQSKENSIENTVSNEASIIDRTTNNSIINNEKTKTTEQTIEQQFGNNPKKESNNSSESLTKKDKLNSVETTISSIGKASDNSTTLVPNKISIPNIVEELTPTRNQKQTQNPQATIDKTFNISPLVMRNSEFIFDKNWSINQNNVPNIPLPKEDDDNNKKTGEVKNHITAFAAPTILKNNIRPPRPSGNPPPNPPNPPNNQPPPIPTETVNVGKAIGFKYGREITDKLTLNIGGMYANTNFDSHTRHRLSYNKDSEQDLNTDKVSNNIDYSGSGTYGDYKLDLDITRRRNNNINQGEEIDIEINATTQIHAIIIPAYVTYEMFNIGDFSIGLKGGVSYNNIVKSDMQVTDFKIKREGFEVRDARLGQRPKPSKKWNLNMISGVSVAYDFNDNFALVVEPTWSYTLSDHHKADFGRTKSNILNVEVGVRYSF